MGKLYLEGNGIIKHNGIPATFYDFKDNEEIMLEFQPFASKNLKLIPYAVSVAIEEGDLNIDSDLITSVKWQDDYEIRFKPLVIDSYEPPSSLAQNAVYTPNGDITVTVIKDSKTRVLIEAPGVFHIHTTIETVTEPEIKMNLLGDKAIVAITGNYNKMNYLLIMMIADTCKILYEDIADKITFNQNNIKLSKNLMDMCGRTINLTLSYNGTHYAEIARSYECTYKHKYNDRLIPYAFLEALMAGDIADAKTYLDKNLDIEALKEFFGKITEISEPKYNLMNEDRIAIIAGSGNKFKAHIYEFVIENELITNVIEC